MERRLKNVDYSYKVFKKDDIENMTIDYDREIYLGELEEYVEKCKSKNVTHIDFYVERGYEGEIEEIQLTGSIQRNENGSEWSYRIKNEENAELKRLEDIEKAKEKEEKELYLKLKEKYEK